jgi:predicted DNA-binding transcriptional regulator YafY
VASFSPEKRNKVNRLKSRILIGVTASTYVQASASAPPKRVVQAVHQAFIDQKVLDLRYQREDGVISDRQIEPQYLLLKYPIWYVVAIDHLKNEPRTFRCDRMLAALIIEKRFKLRPKEEFQPSLVGGDLSL